MHVCHLAMKRQHSERLVFGADHLNVQVGAQLEAVLPARV